MKIFKKLILFIPIIGTFVSSCSPIIIKQTKKESNEFQHFLETFNVKVIDNELKISFSSFIDPFTFNKFTSPNASFILNRNENKIYSDTLYKNEYKKFLSNISLFILSNENVTKKINEINCIQINDISLKLNSQTIIKTLYDLLKYKRGNFPKFDWENEIFELEIFHKTRMLDTNFFEEVLHYAILINRMNSTNIETWTSATIDDNLEFKTPIDLKEKKFTTLSLIENELPVFQKYYEQEYLKYHQDELSSKLSTVQTDVALFLNDEKVLYYDAHFGWIFGQPILTFSQIVENHSGVDNDTKSDAFWKKFYFKGSSASIENKIIEIQNEIDSEFHSGIASKPVSISKGDDIHNYRYFKYYLSGSNPVKLTYPGWLDEIPTDDIRTASPTLPYQYFTLRNHQNFPLFNNKEEFESWMNNNFQNIIFQSYDGDPNNEFDNLGYSSVTSNTIKAIKPSNSEISGERYWLYLANSLKIDIQEIDDKVLQNKILSINNKIWWKAKKWK